MDRRAQTTLNKALVGRQPNVVSFTFIFVVLISYWFRNMRVPLKIMWNTVFQRKACYGRAASPDSRREQSGRIKGFQKPFSTRRVPYFALRTKWQNQRFSKTIQYAPRPMFRAA